MKKRIITMLLATTLAITLLSGCGTNEPATNSETSQTTENLTEVTEETESTEEVTETTEQPATQETEQTEEQTETPAPTYTYTDLDKTMFAKQSVNVRSLPSTDGEKLGALSFAQEIKVTGQCNETKWYRIDYNGSVAYVSNNYLVDEKPVAQTTPSTNNDNGGSNGGTTSNSSGRYGGSWDYVDNSNLTYTGASLYKNDTYNTSISVPTSTTIFTDTYLRQMSSEDDNGFHVLVTAAMYDIGVTITLVMYENYASGSDLWNHNVSVDPFNYNLKAEYDTTIGTNTYHCYEYTQHNGTQMLLLTRNSGGKLIEYTVSTGSIDVAKQYILY